MSDDTKAVEYPKPIEKLAYKFILDTLIEERKEEASATPEAPPAEECLRIETPVVEVAVEADPDQEPEIEAEPEAAPIAPLELPAGKKYFRIREVAALTGVEPYVLRYWENEFSTVRPTKSSTGQRVYSRRDVEELHLIRHLLHVEKYSIKGAKKRLQERRHNRASGDKVAKQRHIQQLKELQAQVRELLQIARGNPGLG